MEAGKFCGLRLPRLGLPRFLTKKDFYERPGIHVAAILIAVVWLSYGVCLIPIIDARGPMLITVLVMGVYGIIATCHGASERELGDDRRRR